MKYTTILLVLIGFSFSISAQQTIDGSIMHDGIQRDYILYIPAIYDGNQEVPLVLNFHGFGSNANQQMFYGDFRDIADTEGFILVHPQGTTLNGSQYWNVGSPGSSGNPVDDVGFIEALIDELANLYAINLDRVYATGMSNGGFMSGRLVCDRADVFRGAAILTAQISKDYLPLCKPSQPTAILVMNGTEDKIVPYDGGQITVFRKTRGDIISTDEFIKFWKNNNNCTSKKTTVNLPNKMDDGTTVSIEEYSNCADRGALKLYKINGGGHTWPGGRQYLGEKWIGKTSREINACEVIWDYFKSL